MEHARPGREGTTALRWGLAGTVLLALAVGAVSLVEIQRARREVDALARTADRSSFLVGEVGRQLSRLHAVALERSLDPGAQMPALHARARDIDAALDRALVELDTLLQPEEREHWDRFVPDLVRFRSRLAAATGLLAAGAGDAGERIVVDELGPLAGRLEEHLDVLGELNQEESRLLLAAADHRLARLRATEAVLNLALVGGLVVIWLAMLRILGRQRGEREAYLERIERSNRDLDAFAGRIAHDLGNTLAPIAMVAKRLRLAAPRGESVEPVASLLDRTVRQGRALIEGLLAFSRAAAPARMSEGTPLAVAVHDALAELAPVVERLGARVRVSADDAWVACPPGLVHLVATNLIGNALKFLEGQPHREVSVTVGARDGRAELAVSDTGPGIPTDALPRIFEPFYRAPGVKAPGTGIGLATVRRIVDAHGGDIAIASTPGQGTRVRVSLPLGRRPPVAATDALAPPAAPA
jgi:signal transduction histidine kinase